MEEMVNVRSGDAAVVPKGTTTTRREFLMLGARAGGAVVVATALAVVPSMSETAEAATYFRGVRFGRKDNHHYVEFAPNMCARGWRVEGPLNCDRWIPSDGKPICGQPWSGAVDRNGRIRAGIRWPDGVPLPPNITAWSFKLYAV